MKLNKAMNIARKREATVHDIKSLEQQGASSVHSRETNIDAIRQNQNLQCGKCGLNHGKTKCLAQGTRCRKCNQWNHWEQVQRYKQVQDRESRKLQNKSNQSRIHLVEESNSDFDELLFKSIQIDSSTVNPARGEAFAKV